MSRDDSYLWTACKAIEDVMSAQHPEHTITATVRQDDALHGHRDTAADDARQQAGPSRQHAHPVGDLDTPTSPCCGDEHPVKKAA